MIRSKPHLVCVYRRRNAALVTRIIDEAVRAGASVGLWALDEQSPELAEYTQGVGPGLRLALLNRLIATAPKRGVLVVVDDDVVFEKGHLRKLLRLARLARLDIAQPAHAPRSFVNHHVTAVREHSVARLTRFVEVGPLVVIGKRARPLITPFPEAYGMGWGLDILWSDLVSRGCRLGVVDSVTIRHTAQAASEYSTADGERMIAALLEARGLPNMGYFSETLRVWPQGFPLPPWVLPGIDQVARWCRRRLARPPTGTS